MTNAKGEWVYTTSEIGNALGISPNTIRAIGKRLYGITHFNFTLDECKAIKRYLDSVDKVEDARRLAELSVALGVTERAEGDA